MGIVCRRLFLGAPMPDLAVPGPIPANEALSRV
jgi:hypothetical protein